jgi:TRAP-type uncharacterized transport system substrate-binding protein
MLRRVLIALAVVLIAGGLFAAVALIDPLPPRSVVMATGAQGGAYAATGRRYQTVLSRSGVHLDLRATNGSLDNLGLLRDPAAGVSIALAQGGLTMATESTDVVSLGTVFYEPIWIFARGTPSLEPGSRGFTGRVSIGESGSGTRALATELLASIGQDLSRVEVVDLSNNDAGEALLRGELDMAMMVSGWEAQIVHRLLIAPGIATLTAPRADAQVALRPYLSKLTLPHGVADLVSDRPPADVQLMAGKASLLVRKDLHPAIQYLLLEAASEIHGGPGIFHRAGQFPAAEPMDLPLSDAARQYHRSGVPWLQRHLPFWLASLAAQALMLLVPILGVVYPIFKLLPALYGWIMRRRIFHLYGELKFLEAELEAQGADKAASDLSAKLDQLEARADHMHVPKAFTHMVYTLRLHIEIVRKRIANAGLRP